MFYIIISISSQRKIKKRNGNFSAQDFHEKYLRDIEHQNIYITKYFKKIDARRFKNGKHTLLPLKKMEKQKLINPYSLKFHSTEMNRLVIIIFFILLWSQIVSYIIFSHYRQLSITG